MLLDELVECLQGMRERACEAAVAVNLSHSNVQTLTSAGVEIGCAVSLLPGCCVKFQRAQVICAAFVYRSSAWAVLTNCA